MSAVAIILAGGLGTRLRHIIGETPKPLVEVCGKPFIAWVMELLKHHGFNDLVVSSGYRADLVTAFFRLYKSSGVKIREVREPKPLGTAGALLHTWSVVRRTSTTGALVLNGDSLVACDLARFISGMRADDDASVLGVRVEDTSRYGTLTIDENNKLLRFSEKNTGSGLINAGIYYLKAHVLNGVPYAGENMSMEYDLLPKFLSEGISVRVMPVSAPFLDIGTEESLSQATEFIGKLRDSYLRGL